MTYVRRLLPFSLMIGFLLVYLPPQLAAQTENRAALVVNMGSGNVQTRCVTFSESQITGYDLLVRSGMNTVVDVQGVGSLVCSIDGVGCAADDCLCQCKGGGDCVYWSYWHQIEGNWQYSSAGASIYPITNGMVDGWSWGPGSVNEAMPPPNVAFEDVCQAPATATHTATAVPPTATSLPTNTPTLAATPVPEIEFSVDATTLNTGACTNLRWRTANIFAVYLNNDGVVGEETREICPTQTETYSLKVLHPGGEEIRSLTITVLAPQETPSVTPINSVATVVVVPTTAVPPPNNENPGVTTIPSATVSSELTNMVVDVAVVKTATAETIWVTVPPQPTATEVAAAAVMAALPPTPQSEVPAPQPAASPIQAEAGTAVSWSSYIAFLVIMLTLGLLIFRAGQRQITA